VSLLNSSCVASLYDKGVGMALEGLEKRGEEFSETTEANGKIAS